MAGPRALPRLPVDAEAKLEIVGRAHLVGRRQPRPQYRVAVGRLPEAALLAAANCDVQSDRVAGDVVERVAPADRLRGLADDERELHFMIVAAVELAQGDALTRAGEGARRLQKQSGLVNRVDLILVVQAFVAAHLVEMLLVVYRSG